MFKNEYPVFVRKHLLKIEMLENIRDYPRDIVELYYKNYSNGVLKGCEIEVRDDYLFIHPGILIFNHVCYIMREETCIPYMQEDHELYLKIKFSNIQKEREKVSYLSQILLDHEETNQKDEIELGRFLLQKGHRIRDDHEDFADLSTPYNTLNYIHVPYAAEGASTLSPYILNIFAEEALKYKDKNPIDAAFCIGILQNDGRVSRKMLIAYINLNMDDFERNYTNVKIYKSLQQILERLKNERVTYQKKAGRPGKIMLD